MTLKINGGNRLYGGLRIFGAKNAFLPILAACCVSGEDILIHNIPLIDDSFEKIEFLENNGCSIIFESNRTMRINTLNLQPKNINSTRIRTSILLLGVFLIRFGFCIIPIPAGDKIGTRAINFHIDFLEKMGASFVFKEKFIEGSCDKLRGIEYTLPFPSVGATQNMIITASLANGMTIINNAAIEPEITYLCNFLLDLGVKIYGVGQPRLVIEGNNGVLFRNFVETSIICDRLQAATYLVAAGMTGGEVTIYGENLHFLLGSFLDYLNQLGLEIYSRKNEITAKFCGNFEKGGFNIYSNIFPGLATDLVPILVPLLCINSNSSKVEERLFDDRFRYINEFRKMGCNLLIKDKKTLFIENIAYFNASNNLIAHDIRGGASVLLAALNAKGESKIFNAYQIYRGYDNLINNFCDLGADMDIDQEFY